MKEIYTTKLEHKEIVKEGTYKGFHYKIVSYGHYPCAYIQIPKTHKLYEVHYDNIDISVHGGLTYSDKTKDSDEYWIGWDYAHSGDFMCYPDKYHFSQDTDKKWTVEEIEAECKDAIDQITKLKKFRVKKYYYATEESDWR